MLQTDSGENIIPLAKVNIQSPTRGINSKPNYIWMNLIIELVKLLLNIFNLKRWMQIIWLWSQHFVWLIGFWYVPLDSFMGLAQV